MPSPRLSGLDGRKKIDEEFDLSEGSDVVSSGGSMRSVNNAPESDGQIINRAAQIEFAARRKSAMEELGKRFDQHAAWQESRLTIISRYGGSEAKAAAHLRGIDGHAGPQKPPERVRMTREQFKENLRIQGMRRPRPDDSLGEG
jgi:hypothetical protein